MTSRSWTPASERLGAGLRPAAEVVRRPWPSSYRLGLSCTTRSSVRRRPGEGAGIQIGLSEQEGRTNRYHHAVNPTALRLFLPPVCSQHLWRVLREVTV